MILVSAVGLLKKPQLNQVELSGGDRFYKSPLSAWNFGRFPQLWRAIRVHMRVAVFYREDFNYQQRASLRGRKFLSGLRARLCAR